LVVYFLAFLLFVFFRLLAGYVAVGIYIWERAIEVVRHILRIWLILYILSLPDQVNM